MGAPTPVSWRDGVHIAATPIWCDARRARDVCFVSHGEAVRPARHGQLIATAATLALLARQGARRQAETVLAVPYDRPFTLGTRRLELFRSGHAIGAASLAVDVDGERVVYAGPIQPHGGGLGETASLRACRTLVVSAHYGAPEFAFPPIDDVVGEVAERCRAIADAGGAAVLLVTSAGKGLDVAARLGACGLAARAHREIHHAARRLSDHQIASAPALARFSGRLRPGELVLWPTRAREALDRVELPARSAIILVSGGAQDPGAVRSARADLAYPWSNQADYRSLIEYVDASGAERVFFTHRLAEPMARAIDRPARPARAIGPPLQMSLFS